MNVFEAVKEAVTTRNAAEAYGIKVNRSGMVCCPFHNDKNPSMKVDKRYHCFGCQEDGDVINFTAKLFNLNPKEAAEKLASDFGVGYEQRQTGKPWIRASPVKPKLTPAQEYQIAEKHCYLVYCDYLHILKYWKDTYYPRAIDEEPDSRFVEACHKITYVEYLLDILLIGSIEERAEVVKSQGKEVHTLERRISERATERTDGSSTSNKRDERTTTSR